MSRKRRRLPEAERAIKIASHCLWLMVLAHPKRKQREKLQGFLPLTAESLEKALKAVEAPLSPKYDHTHIVNMQYYARVAIWAAIQGNPAVRTRDRAVRIHERARRQGRLPTEHN